MGACCGKDELGATIPRNPAVDCAPLVASRAKIVCLIGGPGAGKQTLGKRLAGKYGLTPVIMSDLVRSEVSAATERGEIMKRIMRDGRNLPADVAVQKVEEKMASAPTASGYLLVGFPRDKQQAILFERDVRRPDLCVYLWARRQVLEERMRTRATANERFDDAEFTIAERMKTFFGTVGGAVARWKAITTTVDGERSEEEVLALACAALDAMTARLQS